MLWLDSMVYWVYFFYFKTGRTIRDLLGGLDRGKFLLKTLVGITFCLIGISSLANCFYAHFRETFFYEALRFPWWLCQGRVTFCSVHLALPENLMDKAHNWKSYLYPDRLHVSEPLLALWCLFLHSVHTQVHDPESNDIIHVLIVHCCVASVLNISCL